MTMKPLHRVAIVAGSMLLILLFSSAGFVLSTMSSAQLILATAAIVFCYIVVRLTGELFAADARDRRRAQRLLVFSAAIPVLILTPSAIGASPRDVMPMILLFSAIWLAIGMSYTSYILGSARTTTERAARSASQRHAFVVRPAKPTLRPRGLTRRTQRT